MIPQQENNLHYQGWWQMLLPKSAIAKIGPFPDVTRTTKRQKNCVFTTDLRNQINELDWKYSTMSYCINC